MLKAVGVCLVFAGICGTFFCWSEKNRTRIAVMEAFSYLVSHAAYQMETEKLSAGALFFSLSGEEERFREPLRALCKKMDSCAYPSAEALWCSVWMPYMEAQQISGEFMQLVKSSARGFFGEHVRENTAILHTTQARMLELMLAEKQSFAEKKKVAAPVSLLGGIMAVIILW